jgi:hypothetical protein
VTCTSYQSRFLLKYLDFGPIMAPVQQDGNNNKVAVSMGILVIVIAVIVFAVWFTHRLRPPVILPASVRNQRRREEELFRKEIGHFLLESLPVITYNKRLQTSEHRAIESNNTTWSTYLPTRSAAQGEEKSGSVHSEVAVATGEDKCEAEMTVDNSDVSNNKTEILEEHEQHDRDQPRSRDESASCSVCTEDFAENDTVRILPCGHIYHRRCIDPWLLDFGSTCPLW